MTVATTPGIRRRRPVCEPSLSMFSIVSRPGSRRAKRTRPRVWSPTTHRGKIHATAKNTAVRVKPRSCSRGDGVSSSDHTDPGSGRSSGPRRATGIFRRCGLVSRPVAGKLLQSQTVRHHRRLWGATAAGYRFNHPTRRNDRAPTATTTAEPENQTPRSAAIWPRSGPTGPSRPRGPLPHTDLSARNPSSWRPPRNRRPA